MAEQPAHPESIVSTQWVADNLGNSDVVLVEVDVDTAAYDQGHVPGAVGWNWSTQLNDQLTRDILTREQMESLLGGSGIGNDTTVVLYGDNNNWFATYAFWQMRMYGHDDLKIMDGGRQKWIDEGRETSMDAPSVEATAYTASNPDTSIRATRDYVLGVATTDNSTDLVDVRAPEEFDGTLLAPAHLPQEGSQRGGHIPGAANVPWATAVAADGTFKSVEELREIYEGKGITGEGETIAYCRIGERSSHTWFVLSQILGHGKVRNYDGSWTEYGSIVGAPIEK
ncbi:MAG: sulfurtransferase [Dehalococcoidia bacterium]|nr:sulfurtransferase [Dehalococcoidia bacterium]